MRSFHVPITTDVLNERLMDDLRQLVEVESKTGDLSAVERCADVVRDIGNELLGPIAEAKMHITSSGPLLTWSFGTDAPHVAMVGHYDTVFPAGTLASFPFTVEGDVARGPGAYDMKAGLLVMFYACRIALEADPASLNGLVLVCDPDEEDGSTASRPFFEQLVANGLQRALVFEGGGPNGEITNRRKGGMWLSATFHGRAAHGAQPHEGVNALVAMAHFVNGLAAIDIDETTITPSMVTSGESINSVPASAELFVDIRFPSPSAQRLVDDALQTIAEDNDLDVTFSWRHRFAALPVEASFGLTSLLAEHCLQTGRRMPALKESYGLTDGNHLAGMGVEVLDGLGPSGGGDHSLDEHVVLNSVMDRARLMSTFVPSLLA